MNQIPVIPSLVIVPEVLPPVVNRVITLKVGFFASDESLTDVTSSTTITLAYPLDGSVTQLSNNTFITNQIVAFGVTAVYSTIYYTTYNLQVVAPQSSPSQQDIYNLLKQEEPQGVYTQDTSITSFTYLDNWVTSGLIAEGAATVFESFQNVYPEAATNLLDYYIEFFGNDIITPVYPNALIQQMNNLALIPGASAYVVASNITYFIYNLTGFEVPVSINDFTIDEFDYWILGVVGRSELGTTTYLAPSSGATTVGEIDIYNQGIVVLTQQEKNLINTFIAGLIRPTKQYTVTYDVPFAGTGFDTLIGNTYYGDIRLVNGFAIKYDPTAFYGYIAYVGTFDPQRIIGIQIFPTSGSTISGTVPTEIEITGEYEGGYYKGITVLTKIAKHDDNILIAWNTLIPLVPSTTTSFTISFGSGSYEVSENVTYTLT